MVADEPIRIAIVVPATRCPRGQVLRIREQLSSDDRIVVSWNGVGAHSPCCDDIVDCLDWIASPPFIGAASARNCGVATVVNRAKVLLFCDCDDLVDSNWVAKLAAPLLDGAADLSAGSLRFVTKRGGRTLVLPESDYGYKQAVFGGNCGVSRAAWLKLDGFDAGLRCCEDTDFAWRAVDAGLRVQVVPGAVVNVFEKPLIAELVQRFRWGVWDVRLLNKHHLALNRLPGMATMMSHTRSLGYSARPCFATLAHQIGFAWGRYHVNRLRDEQYEC